MGKESTLTISEYLKSIPEEQRPFFDKVRQSIQKAIDNKFEECISYGMIGYVVPKTLYPNGYHCDPNLPLPFAGLSAQKNSINIYHMGIYADDKLLKWFQDEYAKQCKFKLDMGKSCVRFKKYNDIPYKLIEELFGKLSVKDWIALYERALKR